MAADRSAFTPKILSTLRMLGESEEEALVALRALRRMNVSFKDMSNVIEAPPPPPPPVHPSDAQIEQILEVAKPEAEEAAHKRVMREYGEWLAKFAVNPDGSYDWRAMALFVQRRKDRLAAKDRNFADSIAAQAAWYGTPGNRTGPTEPQRPWLLSLFRQLGGKLE
jgi:hypothetical protein